MGTYMLDGIVYGDDSMVDGYIRFEVLYGDCRRFFMTEATWFRLTTERLLHDVLIVVEAKGEGTHLVPRTLIESAEAREIRMTLDLLEPAESDTCTLPHCWQASTTSERGFPLCTTHAAALSDWDSLTA